MQKAQNFVLSRHKTSSNGKMKMAFMMPKMTAVSGSGAYYYVFNVGEQDGYVIVSGDDFTDAILGYADSGSFDENNLPTNMKAWLSGYERQMKWIDANMDSVSIDSAANSPQKMPTKTKHPIAPLVQTKWNQDAPFNSLCPTYNGQKSYTGCVATSMAQVMYYNKWPKNASVSIPAYATSTRHINVDALNGTGLFDWDDMKLSYNGTEEGASATAVATLMQYCGASIEMDYYLDDAGESGAVSANVATALRNYYNYASSVRYLSSSDYSMDGWLNLIYNELDNKRPVIYAGAAYAGGAHSFVCDGYDDEDYFHINWGWGGVSDG